MFLINKNPLCALKFSAKKLKTNFLLLMLPHNSTSELKYISSKMGKVSYIEEDDETLVFIGIDKFDESKYLTVEQYSLAIGAHVFDALKAEGISKINIDPSALTNEHFLYGALVRSFTNGAEFKGITIGGVNSVELQKAKTLSESANFTRRLINMPHGFHTNKGKQNGLTVQSFVKVLSEAFQLSNSIDKCTYSTRNDLSSIGAGGILSVGRGSEESPALMEISYCHEDCKLTAPTIFVVKGVMYDTGGAAIKSAAGMVTMKYDMASAATAAGILHALRISKAKVNFKVIFCLADNAVSARMTLNGDYVEMMDGKIVEITNTDAEGRVVLYDGLVYAQNKYPDAKCYVSMGTLTGTGKAVMGSRAAMYFCRDESLNEQLDNAAQGNGLIDGIFRLPVDPRTASVVHSKEPGVDLCNYTKNAGTSASELAYCFLKASMQGDNENKYIHFDIANVGGGKRDITGLSLPYFSGTGWGVFTLSQFVKDLS